MYIISVKASPESDASKKSPGLTDENDKEEGNQTSDGHIASILNFPRSG